MKIQTATALILSAALLGAGAAHAAGNTAPAADQGLTRAEVQADLAMWNRAGMNKFDTVPADNSAEYKQAKAEYLKLRNGPEYQAELSRLQNANLQAQK